MEQAAPVCLLVCFEQGTGQIQASNPTNFWRLPIPLPGLLCMRFLLLGSGKLFHWYTLFYKINSILLIYTSVFSSCAALEVFVVEKQHKHKSYGPPEQDTSFTLLSGGGAAALMPLRNCTRWGSSLWVRGGCPELGGEMPSSSLVVQTGDGCAISGRGLGKQRDSGVLLCPYHSLLI